MLVCKKCRVKYEGHNDGEKLSALATVVCSRCYDIEIKRFDGMAFGVSFDNIDDVLTELISSIEENPLA